MHAVIQTDFHGQTLTILHHDGQQWLTAEQVGLALGYAEANARQGINNLYNRHSDEFTDQDTFVIKLMTNPLGGNPTTRIFSATGCQLLGFFANTTRAKAFRQWAKQVLAAQAPVMATIPASTRYYGRVTRLLERKLLEAFVIHNGPQKDLAQHFGISLSTCNMILHGKYQFGPATGPCLCSDALLDAVAARTLANEQARLLAYQQGIANRLRHTANNQPLADRLDRVGQHLQQAPQQALLPMLPGAKP